MWQKYWDKLRDQTQIVGAEKAWQQLITLVYQDGADQELIECLRYASDNGLSITRMRLARRPKPPSLKEQALLQLDTLNADLAMHGRGCDLSQIRLALEALND